MCKWKIVLESEYRHTHGHACIHTHRHTHTDTDNDHHSLLLLCVTAIIDRLVMQSLRVVCHCC